MLFRLIPRAHSGLLVLTFDNLAAIEFLSGGACSIHGGQDYPSAPWATGPPETESRKGVAMECARKIFFFALGFMLASAAIYVAELRIGSR